MDLFRFRILGIDWKLFSPSPSGNQTVESEKRTVGGLMKVFGDCRRFQQVDNSANFHQKGSVPEILFGYHPVSHALNAKRRRLRRIHLLREEGSSEVESLLKLAREDRVPVEKPTKGFFARYAQFAHQGVIAEADPYPFADIETLFGESTLLLCDGIQDPQNLGALCRTALLMGVGGVVLTGHRAVSVTSAVCKAAAGAVEYLKIVTVSSLPKVVSLLKEHDFWVYGADSGGEKSLYDERFPEKVALVIGGEGGGLSRLTRERCDIMISIPMPNPVLGSLNASVSGAILLAEIVRQKMEKMPRTS